MYRCTIIVMVLVLLALIFPGSALAQVTTLQTFHFGEFIIRRNDAFYQITVRADGSYTYNTIGLTMLTAPRQGIYDIGGFTPGTAVASVDVSQIAPLTNGRSNLDMILFYDSHDAAVDGSGYVTVNVGATLQTSGDGSAYDLNSTYSGTIQIQVNF